MSKDDNPTQLEPRLRFPEFRGASPWMPKTLAQTFGTITNGKANAQDHDEAGEFPLFDRSETIKRSPYYLFDAEAVILPGEGAHFTPRRFGGKFNLHQRAYALMDCREDINFAYYAIDEGKGRLATKAVKSTVLSLRMPIIEKFTIACPDPKEQRKIAECLGSLDDWIAAETEALAALRRHKTGLMQQLFPRPGETRPRLRFPEFRDAGDWRDSKLGALAEIVRGGSPRPIDSFLTRDADGLNWLKIGDLVPGAKYVTGTEDRVIPEALSKTRVIEPGDLILSNSMSFGRPYLSQITTCIHDGWIAVRKIKKRVRSEFLYYAIMAPGTQAFFEDWASGGGIRNLNIDIVKSAPMWHPDTSEQDKIADCLASIDLLLASKAEKLGTLQHHKRGLMQQLFPAPDLQPGEAP